jgi:predicted membrane-bound spermidine synthase
LPNKFKNRQSFFEKLLSLLQGAAWALVAVGSISFFLSLYHSGIVIALLGAFIGALLGLFFVILFEIAQIQIDKLKEMKKQTALLEKLTQQKDTATNI